jgi:hypothetical protein
VKLKAWIILLFFLLAACIQPTPPAPAIFEITGDRAHRVAEISALLAKQQPPPTSILDAYFRQERMGDGELGPSDYRTFWMIAVAPADLPHWQALLSPRDAPPAYQQPATPQAWWITRAEFAGLTFYNPESLTNSVHGWIGVSPATGRIFIFTFTT